MARNAVSLAVLVTTIVAAVSGCNAFRRALPQSVDVALETDALTYTQGEAVQLTLRNVYRQRIGYNLCSSQLERNVDGTWERVEEDRNCTAELRLLAPGDMATFTVELPDTLAAGPYRYMTHVESMEDTRETPGDDGRLATNPFEVQG